MIGNSNYTHPKWYNLSNALSDARDVAEKLKTLGFDVMMLADGNLDEMTASINHFFEKANNYNVAMFYFSGHGKREGDDDYILSTECANNEFTMSDLIEKSDNWIANGYGYNRKMIYVIDACRNSVGGKKSNNTAMPKKKTILFYSTSRDDPAWDQLDDDSGNGPFAQKFIPLIGSTGKKIDEEFKIIRDSVEYYATRRGKEQHPEVVKDIDFAFRIAEVPQNVGVSPKEAYTLAKANLGRSMADINRRIELYKIASQSFPAAKDSLGSEYEKKGNTDSAFYWYSQSKSNRAIYKCALIMLDPANSQVFGKQRTEALKLLESIADRYSPAAYYLGMIYVNDNFFRISNQEVELYNKGLSLLKTAAQKGHREASEMLKELSE